MSKNNTNQNNNGRNYNNNRKGRNNNFNDHKKVVKHPRVNPNEIKVPLYLPANLNENITNEILDVLAATKFNKISFPLGTYRCLVDSSVDENDTRICTIGHVRGYNAETKEFTVIVFDKFIETIKSHENVAVDLMFTTYKENLGTITKINIVPAFSEEKCEDSDEVNK